MGETDGEADGVFEHPAVISATAATKQTRRICVYYTARNVGVPLRGGPERPNGAGPACRIG